MINAAMVGVNYNGNFYKLYAMSNAGIHFLELDAPVIYLNNEISENELGEAVLKLLPYCKKIDAFLFKQSVPIIKEEASLREKNEMQKYGYSSRKKLFEFVIQCGIMFLENKQQYKISPTHHDSLDGFSGNNKEFHINDISTAQEIGEAIKKGLRLCTAKSSYKLPVVF